MFLVETVLKPSPIHGLGVFSVNFIPKGTLVQEFIEGIDVEIAPAQFDALPDAAKSFILHFGYKHFLTGHWILCADNARYLNHSETPNLTGDESGKEADIAACDIRVGDELTVNYREFDSEFLQKVGGL